MTRPTAASPDRVTTTTPAGAPPTSSKTWVTQPAGLGYSTNPTTRDEQIAVTRDLLAQVMMSGVPTLSAGVFVSTPVRRLFGRNITGTISDGQGRIAAEAVSAWTSGDLW